MKGGLEVRVEGPLRPQASGRGWEGGTPCTLSPGVDAASVLLLHFEAVSPKCGRSRDSLGTW